MNDRRLAKALPAMLALSLAGCSGPIGFYHHLEGGAIAQNRQPPPGADLPYPNLANVPPLPAPYTAAAQAASAQRVHSTATGVSPPAPGALAGLELPTAAPPLPNVPGLNLPAAPAPAPAAPPQPSAAAKPPNGVPVAVAFPPGSAVLPFGDKAALAQLAAARGDGARFRVGGFGDGTSLALAIARAQRLGNALTAAGVPPGAVTLVAGTAGSGGFAQLVY